MNQNWSTVVNDWAFYSDEVLVENPEYLKVTTDSESKVLEGIKLDGTKVIKGDLEVKGNIVNQGIQEQIDAAIEEVHEELEPVSYFESTESPEWLQVHTDSNGMVVGGRNKDGAVKEFVSLESPVIKAKEIKSEGITAKFSIFQNVQINGSLELTDDIVKYILSNNINDGSVKALYPKYEWEGYIANLATTKNLGTINDRTYKPLVLQHFSDIHNSAIGCKRVIEFYNMYKEYITDILLSGDMVGSDWTVYNSGLYKLDGYENILKVIGNHDVVYHYGQPGEPATEEACYERYMQGRVDESTSERNDIASWGVEYTENHCYWYKDYIYNTGTKDHFNGEEFDSSLVYEQSSLVTYNNKFYKANNDTGPGPFSSRHWEEITTFGIRLVGYDFEHQTEEQFSWLEQVLSEAITKGLAVILVTHGTPYIDDTTAEFFDTPFDGDEWHQKGVTGCASFRLVEIVSDFIDNGGEFICYLAGHIHTDKCGCFKTGTMVVGDVTYTNNHRQVFIAVGLARCDLTAYDYEATGQSEIDIQKIPYSKTWDLFNLESFDTETKTITVLRVGADIDRLLRSRRSMVIDYQNCELIYTR